jgi:hypothetical protein
MQVTQNLLLVVPLWPPDLKTDLLAVKLPTAKLIHLILREVMVKDNHAARFLFTLISLRNP